MPAIAGVAALLSLVPDVLTPLPYTPDPAYCLQAAVRLAHGQGLTGCSDREPPPLDIASPTYSRLYAWAPGYSVLVAGLLRLGIPLALAANLVKIVAYAGGWMAGAVLARRVLSDGNWLLLFVMAVLPFARVVPLYTQSDVLVWALVPLWMSAVLDIWNRMGASARFRDVAVPVCVLGMLTAAAIVFRWASLFMAPAAAVCIALGAYYYRRPWLLPTAVVLALSLGPYKLIALSNAAATRGAGSLGDAIAAQHTWSLSGLLTDEPLLGLLGRPSGIYRLLATLGSPAARWGGDLVAVPVLIAIAWALARALRRSPDALTPPTGLRVALSITYGIMCAMLLAFTAAAQGSGARIDYFPYGVFEPRYYTIMSLPALFVALQLVASLQHGGPVRRHWRVAGAACAGVLVISGLWVAKPLLGYVPKLPFRHGSTPLEVRQAPERVVVDREIARQAPERVMVFSESAFEFLAEDTIPAYFPPSLEEVPSLHASRPTLLFVVIGPAPDPPTSRHTRYYPPSVEIVRRFHLQEVTDPLLGNTRVYRGVLTPSTEPAPTLVPSPASS